jgi:hypothetical protein
MPELRIHRVLQRRERTANASERDDLVDEVEPFSDG